MSKDFKNVAKELGARGGKKRWKGKSKKEKAEIMAKVRANIRNPQGDIDSVPLQ